MAKITYLRPSGTEFTCEDTPDTQAIAKQHGWVVAKPKKPLVKRKAKAKPKAAKE